MGINGATVLPTAEGQGPGLPGEKHLAPGRAYTVRTESRCAQAAGDMELPDVLARLGPELGAPSHHSPALLSHKGKGCWGGKWDPFCCRGPVQWSLSLECAVSQAAQVTH